MGSSVLLASVMLVLGSLAAGISLQAGSRRLKPGSVLGIRTPSTSRSDEAWHSAQAAASRWLGRAASVLVVGGLVLLAMIGAGATVVGVNLVAVPLFLCVVWCFVKAVAAAEKAAATAEG